MLDPMLFIAPLERAFRTVYDRGWEGDEWIWVDQGRPGGVAVMDTPSALPIAVPLVRGEPQ